MAASSSCSRPRFDWFLELRCLNCFRFVLNDVHIHSTIATDGGGIGGDGMFAFISFNVVFNGALSDRSDEATDQMTDAERNQRSPENGVSGITRGPSDDEGGSEADQCKTGCYDIRGNG